MSSGPAPTHSRLFTRLAPIGLGLALALAAGTAGAVTITIDASKQTAGNPPFWAGAVGTGTASLTLRADLQTHYQIANRELGFQRVRGHGVLNDDMAIYKGAGSYDWTNFDKYLSAIVAAGMRPIMELDFMPKALALNGDIHDTPKDMTAWKNFIQAVVQHCVDKYGAADVSQWYWEVWNEPDYTGFWNGTNASEALTAKMTDYYALYDAAVAGAVAALPTIQIGGPVTTQNAPVQAFLQHCKSAGTRVTFASNHNYGGGAGTTINVGFVGDNNARVAAIKAAGYTLDQVQSLNTEWNSSYSGQGGNPAGSTTSMDNNVNAPFILKSIKLLSDQDSGNTPPLSVFSYWVVSDIFDEGSYIQGKGGTLPFGEVFGLMTYQGIRKAAFNGFKMLSYLGPKRLQSAGGTGNDGVDGLATLSASGDEIAIIVYDFYSTVATTGTDSVTVSVNNVPFAGKPAYVTQFVVDATHSNPYAIWQSQGAPTAPSETQLQAMKAAQHLALAQPVSMVTAAATYTTTFTLQKQGATLLLLGLKRPVTGRNGLVQMEAEDYDGQSAATKEDSNDTSMGQSISAASEGTIFYDVVDFSDAGVSSVQLRVKAQSATTLELHADSASGTLIGKCAVAATGTAWATQSCALTPISGVHALYVLFNGAVHLNWLQFQAGTSVSTGAGGSTGTGGSTATGGTTGTGGAVVTGTGGGGKSGTSGTGGSGAGGTSSTGGSSGQGGSGTATGGSTGAGGTTTGAGGTTTTGTGGNATGGSSGQGGAAPATGGSSGCHCAVGNTGSPPGALSLFGLVAVALGVRRRSARRRG